MLRSFERTWGGQFENRVAEGPGAPAYRMGRCLQCPRVHSGAGCGHNGSGLRNGLRSDEKSPHGHFLRGPGEWILRGQGAIFPPIGGG